MIPPARKFKCNCGPRTAESGNTKMGEVGKAASCLSAPPHPTLASQETFLHTLPVTTTHTHETYTHPVQQPALCVLVVLSLVINVLIAPFNSYLNVQSQGGGDVICSYYVVLGPFYTQATFKCVPSSSEIYPKLTQKCLAPIH